MVSLTSCTLTVLAASLIRHQTSSVYNSLLNGSAERAVRSVKDLFDKDGVSTGDKLIEVVFLINRNATKDVSGSPSQEFF